MHQHSYSFFCCNLGIFPLMNGIGQSECCSIMRINWHNDKMDRPADEPHASHRRINRPRNLKTPRYRPPLTQNSCRKSANKPTHKTSKLWTNCANPSSNVLSVWTDSTNRNTTSKTSTSSTWWNSNCSEPYLNWATSRMKRYPVIWSTKCLRGTVSTNMGNHGWDRVRLMVARIRTMGVRNIIRFRIIGSHCGWRLATLLLILIRIMISRCFGARRRWSLRSRCRNLPSKRTKPIQLSTKIRAQSNSNE